MLLASLLASGLAYEFSNVKDPQRLIVWVLLSTILFSSLLVVYIIFRFRTHFLSILRNPRTYLAGSLRIYLLTLPFLVAVLSLSFWIFRQFGLDPLPQDIVLFYMETDSPAVLFLLFFTSCFIAPFAEEVIFRGLLYSAIRHRFAMPFSVAVSAFIFALFHNEVFSFFALFFLGCVLAYFYEKHKNLWVPVGIHFFNNLFTNLLLFFIKYTDTASSIF